MFTVNAHILSYKNSLLYHHNFIEWYDKALCKYLFNNKGLITQRFNNLSSFNKSYLTFRFNDSYSLEETINRIKKNIEFKPKCLTCGKPTKYIGKTRKLFSTYCSDRCSARNKNTTKKKQETLLKKWGTLHCYDSSLYQAHLKEKYGFEYWLQKESIKNKRKESMLNKYGTLNPYNNTEIRNVIIKTNIERYGCENPMQNEEIRKRYNKSRKNSYNKLSKNELKLKELLIDLYGNNLICQYSSDKYPFNCDFYLIDRDLYIEYHGSHFHNGKPFNPNKHKNELLMLQQKAENKRKCIGKKNQYDMIIYTWTDLDVRKLQIMKNNNLNYLIYYNLPTKEQLICDIEKYKKVID